MVSRDHGDHHDNMTCDFIYHTQSNQSPENFLEMTAEFTSRTGSHLFEYGLTDFALCFTLCILTSLSVEFE